LIDLFTNKLVTIDSNSLGRQPTEEEGRNFEMMKQ
jgi:hypothetical protein